MTNHWKINRDLFFRDVYPVLGDEGLAQAGFFYDTTEHDQDPRRSLGVNCTPLAYVREQLAVPDRPLGQSPAILLTTGSFNPVHYGHLTMMREARKVLEANGYYVVGGFMAPDHDEYVGHKLGKEALPIHVRIRLMADAVKFEPWLNIDPWAGVFRTEAINYTEIVQRLMDFVFTQTGQAVRVFYVCGSDKADYVKVFTHHGHAVLMSRPGYEALSERAFEEARQMQRQFHGAEYQNDGSGPSHILTGVNPLDLSSTAIRPWFVVPPLPRKVYIRITDPSELPFAELVAQQFDQATYLYLADQKKTLMARETRDRISLDPFIPMQHNLGVSRNYDVFGMRYLGFINRPGTTDLNWQVRMIPQGEYILFDEDVQGGATFRFVKELLEKHGIRIKRSIALNETPKDVEQVDARDFILGATEGGLVVNGERVPYLYPYVCPHYRASIPDPLAFSIKMWELNERYHRAKGNTELADQAENEALYLTYR